jgi:glycosyltransferase involved in cell wall biosynthesis
MNVSVVIPTFNSGPFIREALQSVLDQTTPVYEVICVDDASTDNTVQIIQAGFSRVKIIQNSVNKGPSWCRNLGITAATGTVLSFLDADDLWVNDKTHWQLSVFQSEPDVEIIAGLAEYFSSSESLKYAMPDKPHFNAYLSSLLVRRQVFDKIGLFDDTMRLSEDQDWLLRAREARIKMKVKNQTVLKKRIHESNTTQNVSFKKSSMMEALKKSLDRRRETGMMTNLEIIKPE